MVHASPSCGVDRPYQENGVYSRFCVIVHNRHASVGVLSTLRSDFTNVVLFHGSFVSRAAVALEVLLRPTSSCPSCQLRKRSRRNCRAPRDSERMEGGSILITKSDGTRILYTRNTTYSCTSEVYRSFSSTISFMSAVSFNRANRSKSVSGTKLNIPARTSCGYQGTTTQRPNPSDLTTAFAKSSAEGLRREDLPPSPLERTSPTLRYENKTPEP